MMSLSLQRHQCRLRLTDVLTAHLMYTVILSLSPSICNAVPFTPHPLLCLPVSKVPVCLHSWRPYAMTAEHMAPYGWRLAGFGGKQLVLYTCVCSFCSLCVIHILLSHIVEHECGFANYLHLLMQIPTQLNTVRHRFDHKSMRWNSTN